MTAICHVYYIRDNFFCKQKAYEHQVLFPMSEDLITLAYFRFEETYPQPFSWFYHLQKYVRETEFVKSNQSAWQLFHRLLGFVSLLILREVP